MIASPELKTKTVRKVVLRKISWWACLYPYHKHQSEEQAQECIYKHELHRAKEKQNNRELDEYHNKLLQQRRHGRKLKDIAAELGRSSSRARQILARAERAEKKNSQECTFDGLNSRIRNCLLSYQITTVQQVKDSLKNGSIKDIPNLGDVSIGEIINWLGELKVK
jgi:hypothetical protein